jgi:hypothetical protein
MLVVTFAASGTGNCVTADGTAYVYARTAAGSFVMPATCPHRGGPLHLADLAPDNRRLVCPWHEGGVSVARLRKRIPAVRRGSTVTAVLRAEPTAEIGLSHRPLSPALAG